MGHKSVNNYQSNIKLQGTEKPIGAHLNSLNHTVPIIAVIANIIRDTRLHKACESHWITTLKTLHPSGLNWDSGNVIWETVCLIRVGLSHTYHGIQWNSRGAMLALCLTLLILYTRWRFTSRSYIRFLLHSSVMYVKLAVATSILSYHIVLPCYLRLVDLHCLESFLSVLISAAMCHT